MSHATSTLRLSRRMGLAILLAIAAAGTPHASAQSTPGVQVGISSSVQAWVRAVEDGDLSAIRRMHGPDTVVFGPQQMVLRGTEAVVRDYAGMFELYTARVLIEDARFIDASPMLISWGLYTLTLTPRSGAEVVVVRGRFSDVAARDGGGWRYIVDHASVPAR